MLFLNTSLPKHPKTIETNLSIIKFIPQKDGSILVEKQSSPQLIKREREMLSMLANISQISLVVKYSDTCLYFKHLDKFNMKLDLIDIKKYTRQLGAILVDIHAAGVAHFDISPGNLMVDSTGSLVLIDFQLARVINNPVPCCGTPGFIAPELYSNSNVSTKVDIYSAGVVFGILLEPYITGVSLRCLGSPFLTFNQIDEIVSNLEKSLMRNQWPFIIQVAIELLVKMLVSDPSKRRSAVELVNDQFFTQSDDKFQKFEYELVGECLIEPIVNEEGLCLYRE